MSLGALLTHSLAIVTPSTGSGETDWNQPNPGTATTVYVRGLVQPKDAREMALTTQGGAPVSDHVIFLEPLRLNQAGYIRDEPDSGRRFDITGVRSYEFGSAPHLEVDCRLVGSPEGPGVGS